MAKTILTGKDVQNWLKKFGYYDGKIDGNLADGNCRDDLKRFQMDCQLSADGFYGPKSEAQILKMIEKMKYAPPELKEMRRWTLTYYWIANESKWPSLYKVPLMDNKGKVIANVSARFFADLALQGSGVLSDGRLVNVASNPDYIPCDPKIFKPVFDFANKQGWVPSKPGYAGILVDRDGTKAVKARAFRLVPEKERGAEGYGITHKIDLRAFKTVASDAGTVTRSDPAFKGKGGVTPTGSKCFILELAGQKLPDGTIHDGWVVASDVGGGITFSHWDVFSGSQGLASKLYIPGRGHVWFVTPSGQTIEERLPFNYGR